MVMIRRGRTIVEGNIDEIRQGFRRVRCIVDSADAPLPGPLSGWRRDGRFVTGFSTEDPESFESRLDGSGVEVLESEAATLKEVFFERTQEERGGERK